MSESQDKRRTLVERVRDAIGPDTALGESVGGRGSPVYIGRTDLEALLDKLDEAKSPAHYQAEYPRAIGAIEAVLESAGFDRPDPNSGPDAVVEAVRDALDQAKTDLISAAAEASRRPAEIQQKLGAAIRERDEARAKLRESRNAGAKVEGERNRLRSEVARIGRITAVAVNKGIGDGSIAASVEALEEMFLRAGEEESEVRAEVVSLRTEAERLRKQNDDGLTHGVEREGQLGNAKLRIADLETAARRALKGWRGSGWVRQSTDDAMVALRDLVGDPDLEVVEGPASPEDVMFDEPTNGVRGDSDRDTQAVIDTVKAAQAPVPDLEAAGDAEASTRGEPGTATLQQQIVDIREHIAQLDAAVTKRLDLASDRINGLAKAIDSFGGGDDA